MNGRKALFLKVMPIMLIFIWNIAFAGYFTVERHGDRWWFVDPDGNEFFSAGVCKVDPHGFYCPELGYSPYYENIMEKYGSEEAWAQVTLDRLREWNFNTLGAWSDVDLLGSEMPYTIVLNLAGANWQYGTIPDYFSDDFYENVEEKIEQLVVPRVNDENLIGYFLDNELRWGLDWRGFKDLFAVYFSFPYNAPGKIELVNFLRERYHNDVNAFNQAWEMNIFSFDDLLYMDWVPPLPINDAQKEDRADFAGYVANQYFSYCYNAIREVDQNHLILGCRFVSWSVPREVLEAIIPYTDVVSVNHYFVWPLWEWMIYQLEDMMGWVSPEDMFVNFYEITGKPILITEFSMRAFDSGLPNTKPPPLFFMTGFTQKNRADFFEYFATSSLETNYIVGYHWFCYMDEPPLGRFDGEDSNFGLVSNEDIPWYTLVNRMKQINPQTFYIHSNKINKE